MRRRLRLALPAVMLTACALLVPAGSAGAAQLLEGVELRTSGTAAGSCFAGGSGSGGGVVTRAVEIPGPAVVRARLGGPAVTDWDLAVAEPGSGRLIAGSAARGSSELAEGFVIEDTDAVVRACRRSGSGPAELDVVTIPIDPPEAVSPPQLVRVETPNAAAKQRLQGLDLDLTEHGGDDFLSIVSYGPTDLAALNAAGLDYEVENADLVASAVEDRAADASVTAAERTAARRAIPSGRTTYRRLFQFEEELKALAEDNPDLVRPLTLPHPSWEGRTVEGVEITTDPGNVDDGKPVYLQMGAHHAREWPSAEHAMEYALELVAGYRAGDVRITPLVEDSRTIVVPVVNPDGFNVSREAGQILGVEGGRHANSEEEMLVQIVGIAYEFWRKNCRLPTDEEAGQCLGQPLSSGAAHTGVDLNRNYGGLWGGPGASTEVTNPTYRGMGPFSEPETQNIRELVSGRQVTMLISNHTFSNLWLRPPGQAVSPNSPDEALYHALGEEIVAENGYSNIRAWELYDTTGAVEDWSYWSTGGLGYTPEIGCTEKDGIECIYGDFHGPYQDQVVTEYGGGSPSAPTGGGNREAFLIAHEAALAAETHSVIEGSAPAGARLTVQKDFQTETWEGDHGSFPDHLESSLVVPGSGDYEFHVNPSTRPIVQLERGREADGEPSPPVPFSGVAGPDAAPCADFETEDPSCFNDHPFEVSAQVSGEVDNAKITIRADWATPTSDWDLRVFRDSDSDGSSVGETEVAQSGQGTTNFEEVALAEPNMLPPGDYVARMINYAATEPYTGSVTFEGPDPPQGPGGPEAWNLSCERDGEVLAAMQVFVDRGEREQLDLSEACARDTDPGPGPGPGTNPGQNAGACANPVRGGRKRDKLVGTNAGDRLLGFGGADALFGRRGVDCLVGGKGDDKLNGGPGADKLTGGQGRDKLIGGPGNDAIFARDHTRDAVICGKGRDSVVVDRIDKVRGCEIVKRR